MDEKNYSLQKFLQSSAASNNYVPALDSYLYANNTVKAPERTIFFIQTVDNNGNTIKYSINGYNINGLKLSINPSTISINAAKMITRTQTMTGWIEDHWGEELDTITFQGSSAAFIWDGTQAEVPTNIRAPLTQSPEQIRDSFNKYSNIQDLGIVQPMGTGQNSGLAVEMRRQTASYDEFRKIMQLMNANAAKFDNFGLVRSRLYIQMSYDYASYRGYFESFDLTEDANSPFRFTYTITFKSEKTMYTFMR